MRKYLNFNKNYNLFILSFCLIGLVVFWGCGKDDKNVTQGIMPDSIKYGIIDSTYVLASPRSLTVTVVGTANSIDWEPPLVTEHLIGYKIYVSGADRQTIGSISSNNPSFLETTNVTSGVTYTFRVTGIFSFYDTTYNYFTTIESLPSDPFVLDR